MYWIDKNNNAHYANSPENISIDDYNNNLYIIIDENNITDRSGKGNKQFIVQGIGKYNVSVQELVLADSMKECVVYVNRKYSDRIAIGTLLYIRYYEVVEWSEN